MNNATADFMENARFFPNGRIFFKDIHNSILCCKILCLFSLGHLFSNPSFVAVQRTIAANCIFP